MRLSRLSPSLAALALLAAPCAAQTTVDFTPHLGVFVPVRHFTEGADTTRQETRFAIGARLGVWPARSFGLELTADYTASKLNHLTGGMLQFATAGNLFYASGRAVGRLRAGERLSVLPSAGAALVNRGGAFVAGLKGRTELAPTAGLGLLVRLSPHVDARLDVDGYSYRSRLADAAGRRLTGIRQLDLIVGFGFSGHFEDF